MNNPFRTLQRQSCSVCGAVALLEEPIPLCSKHAEEWRSLCDQLSEMMKPAGALELGTAYLHKRTG